METTEWTQWVPPYDPRLVDSTTITEDERGRKTETADCGQRCAGCGICCAGYRDDPTDDEQTPEFEANLYPGKAVELESGLWYHPAPCGPKCPGYGRCCLPIEMRQLSTTVADARKILLEQDNSPRWELEQALMFLAHEGTAEAVSVLQAYLPHAKLAFFAELALEEGQFFASTPSSKEEARAMMKCEVLERWEYRLYDAIGILSEELEPTLEWQRYEYQIIKKLRDAVDDEEKRKDWDIQVSVYQDAIAMTEGKVAEQQKEIEFCEAVVAAIQADLEKEGINPDDYQVDFAFPDIDIGPYDDIPF